MGFIPIEYPREVLELPINGERGWRRIVKDSDELESYWRGKNGSGNVYFTAYAYKATQAPKHHRVDYNTPTIQHFVMDFDCKDFKDRGKPVKFNVPHEQVKRLHLHFMEDNTLHYIWFTGGGFHVWVPLSNTLDPTNGSEVSRIKYAGRKLLNGLDKKLNLSCNDPTVAFDTSGMIRIPNSYNARRECWSIPLTSKQILSLDEDAFYELAQLPQTGYYELGENAITMEVSNSVLTMQDIKPVDIPTVSLDNIHILPCLVQAAMGGGNPPHRARYHFASYLADRLRYFFPAWKISDEEKKEHVTQISNICAQQNWVDYKPEKTMQQVESIVMTGYPHHTCSTLYSEGFCIGKCKYYDGSGDVI